MTQTERRLWLIKYLLAESREYKGLQIPANEQSQKRLLRALLNVRAPGSISPEFLQVQNAYLQAETCKKGVTDIASLTPVRPGIYLWQGDITALRCGAIVNAANSGLTGCYVPNHGCIDNCIHTFAGVQLRGECARLMAAQGRAEPAGRVKLTPAYNLPCDYVLHTVGPIISGGTPTRRECELLDACYTSCLTLAAARGIKSVAFCCISTGEFHFPPELAAKIAIKTVMRCQAQMPSCPEVIFNVFKTSDYEIYKRLLA